MCCCSTSGHRYNPQTLLERGGHDETHNDSQNHLAQPSQGLIGPKFEHPEFSFGFRWFGFNIRFWCARVFGRCLSKVESLRFCDGACDFWGGSCPRWLASNRSRSSEAGSNEYAQACASEQVWSATRVNPELSEKPQPAQRPPEHSGGLSHFRKSKPWLQIRNPRS